MIHHASKILHTVLSILRVLLLVCTPRLADLLGFRDLLFVLVEQGLQAGQVCHKRIYFARLCLDQTGGWRRCKKAKVCSIGDGWRHSRKVVVWDQATMKARMQCKR
jgi:hypothetical protein